jgi:type I restriction enzyme M protein
MPAAPANSITPNRHPWLLFLKYLDALEHDKATEAALDGKNYTHILDKLFAGKRGRLRRARMARSTTIPRSRATISCASSTRSSFPYLQSFKVKATGPNTIEYKIGEIFGEIKNRIQSGYNLREAIDHVDELRFGSQIEKHELSHLYEAKIKNMGNAGRNGGEYYTPVR